MIDHATNDTVEPPNQSPTFSELLKRRGKTYEYLEPAGEGRFDRIVAPGPSSLVGYGISHNIHYAN
jgi:hypothetical protein